MNANESGWVFPLTPSPRGFPEPDLKRADRIGERRFAGVRISSVVGRDRLTGSFDWFLVRSLTSFVSRPCVERVSSETFKATSWRALCRPFRRSPRGWMTSRNGKAARQPA